MPANQPRAPSSTLGISIHACLFGLAGHNMTVCYYFVYTTSTEMRHYGDDEIVTIADTITEASHSGDAA